MEDQPNSGRRVLVVGLGVSGAAAVRHLQRAGAEVLASDDDAGDRPRAVAAELGVELLCAPDPDTLAGLAPSLDEIVVSPGVPASHPVFTLDGPPVIGEVELAWRRARVPVVAVTGTNGKTTVVTLVAAMLESSGLRAVAAGNIGLPLVEAVESDAEILVVEVSSFQLALTDRFRPAVSGWLNFSDDHLDWHGSLDHYRSAKARIWANAGPGDVVVANVEDPVVVAAAAAPTSAGARLVGFGIDAGDWRLDDGNLLGPGGEVLARCDELRRSRPHDVVDALCAAALARAAGATAEGTRAALLAFGGLPHRVELVGEARGVRYFDDSKATTPGAVLAAVSGFDSAVLIAGGRNKGLDLGILRVAAPRLRGVVAIGEAAAEIRAAFEGACPVEEAATMDEAVRRASTMASSGDAVLLSPACASFDWYGNYAERGRDFRRAVELLEGAAPAAGPEAP